MGADHRSSLALRVAVDLSTYERLARSARDAGMTIEGHAGRVLVGAVGGERWQDGLEVAEDRVMLERRAGDVAAGGRGGGGGGGTDPGTPSKSRGGLLMTQRRSQEGIGDPLSGSVEPGVRS